MQLSDHHEVLMFYNAENFFSPDYRSPSKKMGLSNWNKNRYEDKLYKIAHVFELFAKDFGKLPLIIGLAEIQGERVLHDLVGTKPFQSHYGYIHFESMDERGVDVALLYNKEKVEILDAEPISFFFEIEDDNPENYDTTRDVLSCKVKIEGIITQVFVFHLPSKRENDINKPKRWDIIKNIKEKAMASVNEKIPVVLCGDFNENPMDEILQFLKFDEKEQPLLYNPFEDLFQNNHFSTFHRHEGLLFDQFLFSSYFFEDQSPIKFEKAGVYHPSKISDWDRKFLGRPFRTYAGSRYLGGYSDHFPVYSVINIKK